MIPTRLLAVLVAVALPLCAQAQFECQTAPQSMTAVPDCEGATGTVNASPNGDAYVDNASSACGFPAQGSQHLVIPANNPNNVAAPPAGGPVPRPLPMGYNEVQIPVPPGAADVAITWDFYNGEGGGSTFNDGVSIDIVDPMTGLSVFNVVYADTNSPFAPGACLGTWTAPGSTLPGQGTDIIVDGPQSTCVALPALPPGAVLSIACWNGGDDVVVSAAMVDDIQWNTGCPPVVNPNQPNSAEASLSFTGQTCQSPGTLPILRSVIPGGSTDCTIATPTNGQQPYVLVATPGSGTIMGPGIPTPFGVVDLDPVAVGSGNFEFVINGISGPNLIDQLLGNTGATGTRTINFSVPATGTGPWASFQALCADPSNPFGLKLSAATQLDFLASATLPPAFIGTTPDTLASDDSANQLVFTTGLVVPFYGATYSDCFLNSNGNITFGAGDTDFTETPAEFLSGNPRIAPLWDDLNPLAGGTLASTESSSSLIVSWVGIPELGAASTNDFALQIDNLGNVTIIYGAIGATDAIAGISPGGTSPVGPATGASQDLSALLPMSIVGAATDAIFQSFASGFDLAPPCYPGVMTFVPNPPTTTPGDQGYTAF